MVMLLRSKGSRVKNHIGIQAESRRSTIKLAPRKLEIQPRILGPEFSILFILIIEVFLNKLL